MIEKVQKRTFPFQSVLSLRLLIEYWEKNIRAGKIPFSDQLLSYLDRAPELRDPVTDINTLEKHRELIEYLMSAAIAPAQTEKELAAATIPFRLDPIFQTHALKRTVNLHALETSAAVNIPGRDLAVGKTIQACLMILQQFYNVTVNFDKPILFTVRQENGLDKVYKIDIGRQFCEIVSKAPIRPIDPRIIKFLTEKVYDVDLWLQYFRPADFEFRGFMVIRLTDVTEQEMVSSMKYDLLEKDAVTRKESFASIQHKLRSVFGLRDIRLGLAYFDDQQNIILSSDQDCECWKSLANEEDPGNNCTAFQGSVYERSWMEKRYVTVEDLADYPYRSKIEDMLLSKGIRSILIAPLIDAGETVGMLEVATPNPGELNPVTANKVESILPMFTSAVKRVKEESVTEIRAIIQEECTNIHPVVQWRFIQAGKRLLEQRRRGIQGTFEQIVFKDVYPMFGMADIRNSSLERTSAIQQDLLENLHMAKGLLLKIQDAVNLPILEELLFKTDSQLDRIASGLAAGDESAVVEFLTREIHPVLTHFDQDPLYTSDIGNYRASLDPTFGVVYRRRKDFENSLGMINNLVSGFLNEAQLRAQQMFPHYFEKYQTDGVEYTIYLGTSLTNGKRFNPFYLKNFRLWQLLLSIEIEKRMASLKPQLKVPLDITQLILVHDHSLSIRFRPDEKQFDVDGAYDIRYEIIKKRIDKATIKNTGERLTQPGKIAVVYNEPKVQLEYKRYFEFLAAKGLVGDNVEDLEIDALPGATGLRALRIDVRPGLARFMPDSVDLMENLTAELQLH